MKVYENMSKQELDQLWELQGRQAELRRHVLQLTSQLNNAERERSVIDITMREIDAMPDSTKMYMGVGKMFVFSKKQEMSASLSEAKDESIKRDEGRTSLREQFLVKLKESENRIDELAHQIEAARVKTAAQARPSAS